MEKNTSQDKVDNVKNVARLSISRADVKNIKVVDADIVIYLKTGKRIVLRDGVVKAMMDPDFSIGFVDGEISAQAALQQSGLVDLNPISTATVASAPEAEKTDESTTSSTTVSQSASSAPTPTYAEAAAKAVMQAPSSAPEVVAQVKPAPEPSLFDTVRPYIGALGLLGLAGGGGGGGAAVSSASSATGTVVSGTLVLGPVESSNGLTVNLYKADGTWLGSSAVASGGAFSVTLSDKTYSGPIIAVVSDSSDGHDYMDEATGVTQDLGAKYMAIQTVTAGAAASLNINALTTVAAIHAGVPQEWDEGKSTLTKIITVADVTSYNTAVASMFGLSNVVTDSVSPIINSSGSYVASGNYYGQVLAALSGVDKINSDATGDKAKGQKQTISELVAQTSGGVMSSTGVQIIVKGATLASTEASTIAQKVDTSAAKTAVSYESASSLTAVGGVNDLSISVIASLSATAVQKIVDVDGLSDQAFKAINFAYFSDTQVQTLTSTQVASLSKVQLAQMTPTQLAALGNNIIYLGESTLASLSQSSSEKLTSAQLVALAEQGKLDNLSTQLTTSQVNGLAGSLSGSISDADTKLFNSILGDITNGGGVDSSTGVKDFTEGEKSIESALKIKEALAVVHQLNEIAALNPSSSTYAADLMRLSEELTGADLQLIGLAGTSGAYTELQKNALLTKLAEGEVADITGITYLKSLVDVVNPTLSASTLPTTSKTTIYYLAGDGIGETINLTITFSEKVNGLTSGTNSKIFLLDEDGDGFGKVGIEAAWSGTDGTSTRSLTYTIAANQNGKVTIDEAELKKALLASITDVAGNALVYESVIAEIDSSTFARVDGVAPTLTLPPLTDTDLSLAQATSFEQTYLAVDNTNGLGIRTTSAVVKNSAGEVQNGLTLTTTSGKVAGDLSSLAAGSYTLEVTTTDVAGNTDVKKQTFLIDKLAPSLKLEMFTESQTKLTSAEAATYTQTYTSEDNVGGTGLSSTVAVVKNTSGVVQTGVKLSTAGGNISGNLSSLADGRYTVEVTSTDVAGNVFVQTQELVIDKTPAVLNLTSLTDDKLTNQQAKNYTQAYTATDALTEVATTVARVLNSNNEVQKGVVLTTDNGHVTGDLSGLADGQYTIEVTTTDQAGNTTVKTQSVMIDATSPSVNLATLSDTQLTSAEAAVYSQSFTVSDATSRVATTSAVVKNSSGVVQNVTLTTANNKVEGNLSSLGGDENYYVEVTTTDQAGNMTTVRSDYLYIDKTAPTATPLTISSIAKFANLNLGFSEPIVKGSSGSIYICNKLDGTVVETIAVSSEQVKVVGDGKLVTINPVNDLVVDTSYYARVDAGAFIDPSGNPMAAIGANEWNFNAVSVGTSLIIGGAGVNANEGFINADELSQMTLSGVITNAVQATDVAVTRVVFHATDNSGDIVISSSSLSGLLPAITNGTWQVSNDPVWTNQLVSGKTYTVLVDVGGVVEGVPVGSTAKSASFVVDTAAPIISTIPLNAAENGTVVGDAVATDSSSLTWTLVGTGADDAKFNISSSGVLTLKAAKDYETPGSAVGDNAYVVKLKATDAAGNFSIQDVMVNVTNVNEAPVNTVPSAQNTAEETEKVITGLSIADVDAGSATNVTVILSVSNGTLNIAGGTATITGSGTGSVTLKGSVVQINSTLAASNAVKYTPSLNFNGNATLTMTTNDSGNTGTGGALSDVDTVSISVTAVNDAPVATAGATLAYTENAVATVIDNTITLSDVDDTQIAGATVTIGTGRTIGDVLSFDTVNGISGTYNSGTGVLTLTGTATVAQYQAALRTVKYSSTSEDPTATSASRTITWAVTDANSDGKGAQTSTGVTSTINVTAVNDAPVATAGATLAYTENAVATVIDNTITLSDVDDTQIAGATVTIGTGRTIGDVLSFDTVNGISGTYNSGTGVLTLTGTATVAQYQAALRTVKYSSTSEDPTATSASRTITWAVTDANSDGKGAQTSTGVTSTINVTAVNDAPVATAGATLAYTENAVATVIDNTITLSDVDDTQIAGATVTIGTGRTIGDVLSFDTVNGISGTYNSGTGVLTLTGTATVAQYQAALRTVKYSSTSEDPTATSASRTITWAVTDANSDGKGAQTSTGVTSTINVTAVNDAPVATAGATLAYTENAVATVIDNTITLSDVDDTQIAGATVTIGTGRTIGDVLSFDTVNGISGTYNSGTGVLTLTGTATVAQYQAALRTVKYSSTSEDPTATSASRTITWAVTDANSDGKGAQTSTGVTSTINVTAVNDAPVATAGATLAYTENAVATVIDNTITLSDVDDTQIAGATVTIGTGRTIGDVLSFDTVNGISGTYNSGTGVLTLTGTATVAQYQAALRTVKYSSTSEDPTATSASRTITWAVTDANSDGIGAQTSTGVTSTINVTAVNDAPVATAGAGATLAYTENAVATVIDNTITLSDVDDTQIAGATVTIGTGRTIGDVLSFDTVNGISGTYNSGTGVLTLTGTATVAQYQAALRTVKYSSTSEDPTATSESRTITWAVTDANSDGIGAQTSTGVTSTINVTAVNDAPVATAGATLAYTENAVATVIDNTITLSDVDDTQIAGATVTIGTGRTIGDVLSFDTVNGISGTYNSGTGVLTLTGTATVAQYQAALRTVKYSSTSEDPTATSESRTITWAVTDANSDGIGAQTSTGVTSTISVTAVNDAPTLTTTTSTPTYANLAGDQLVFSETTINAIESIQKIKSLVFTVAGVSGTANDRIKFDDSYINLTNANAGSTSTNALTYNVVVTAGTATVTLTSSVGLASETANQLINAMAYNYSLAAGVNSAGMDGNRVVTLTEITDSGFDNNVTSLNLSSTVKDVTPPPSIGALAFSSDSGKVDFVTQSASQTVTAVLSRALNQTERLWGTLDGVTWTNLTNATTGANVIWSGVNLSAPTGVLQFKTVDNANNTTFSLAQSYTLLSSIDSIKITESNMAVGNADTLSTKYRYVYVRIDSSASRRFGFSELEVFDVSGKNVAAGIGASYSGSGAWGTGTNFMLVTNGITSSSDEYEGFNNPNWQPQIAWFRLDLGSAVSISNIKYWGTSSSWDTVRSGGATIWMSSALISDPSLSNLQANAVQFNSGTSNVTKGTFELTLTPTDDTTPTVSGTLNAPLPANYKVAIYDNGKFIDFADTTNLQSSATWTYTFGIGKAVFGANEVQARIFDSDNNQYMQNSSATNARFNLTANTVTLTGAAETSATNPDTLSTKYRYVYVRIDSSASRRFGFSELEVFDVNGKNVAAGIGASYSGSGAWQSGTNFMLVTNGITSSSDEYEGFNNPTWEPQIAWFRLDLGSAVSISNIKYWGTSSSWDTVRSGGATIWMSSAFIADPSLSNLQANAVQFNSGTSNVTKGTFEVSVTPTDDTTPKIFGTLSNALGDGYVLKVFNNGVALGDATVNNDLSWSYDLTTALTSGSTNSFSARILKTSDSSVMVSSAVLNTVQFKVAPVVLDLNGDGNINYHHMLLDVTGAGVVSDVTWASPQDGVLVWDKYGDGLVHNKSQYAFGDPSKGLTDLKGLAIYFDTNKDDVFNAADEKFTQFMVWQDQNADGVSQHDEVKSLMDWGIISLNLNSDGVKSTPLAGVDENGRTTATLSSGQSMVVADATFSYSKALVMQGVTENKDTFTISEALTQINAFSDTDGDVIDLSGLLSQLHATNGNVADYVQTVQRGNHTVIQVDASGHHDFANASNQVVLINTTTTLALLQQQNHVVI